MISSERRTTASHARVGRYTLFDTIATGGMASVLLGRLDGAVGFTRVVAVKRLHPHLALDSDFREMFLTEARLAARIRHPNVVQTFDVVATGEDVSLVMEYIQGESLSWLLRESGRRGAQIPCAVAASVSVNALHGLHAAHEARDEHGTPLEIVHRDVSPQNIMVGEDGVARVFDFGVAKALQSVHQTRAGQVKGKASYMSPEQIRAGTLDRRVDVFAAGIVLWELLTGQRLFHGPTDASRISKVLEGNYPSPITARADIPPGLAAACMRALSFRAEARFATALEFADAIERSVPLASQRKVGEWMQDMASASLSTRAELVKHVETSDVYSLSAPPPPPTGSALAPPPEAASAISGAGSQSSIGSRSASAASALQVRGISLVQIALAGAVLLSVAVVVTLLASRRDMPVTASAPTPAIAATAPSHAEVSAAPSAPAAAAPSVPAAAAPSVPAAAAPSTRVPVAPSATLRRTPAGKKPVVTGKPKSPPVAGGFSPREL